MWLRRVGVDALVGTRWRRRVGGDVLEETRWGVDALAKTRWWGRVGVDALKQTCGRRMCLDFSKNEQSIFPYQTSFPDEPQMQFLSCPWGGTSTEAFFLKVTDTSFPSDS